MVGRYFSQDTIVAIATSIAGDGGVGIIRISGPDSIKITRQFCPKVDFERTRYLQRVHFKDPKTKDVLDDGLVVVFSEGDSFTGELVIELHLHGGRFLLQTILSKILETGLCRLALPGEFTFRAVRNNKMSLTSAAAINQLIHAQSLFEISVARRQISHQRLEQFNGLISKVRHLLAQIELSIDFIDQDIEVLSKQTFEAEVSDTILKLDNLLEQMKLAQKIARGIQVTFKGVPNSGKSTLFNKLLSEDRSIVSEVAGTTRDVVTESFRLGPYYLRLADTAGLRESVDGVEVEGVSRARSLQKESDLILLLIDCSKDFKSIVLQIQAGISLENPEKLLVILNKWDLVEGKEDLLTKITERFKNQKLLFITQSSIEAGGHTKLQKQILTKLSDQFNLGSDIFLPTEFQLQMVIKTKEALSEALGVVTQGGWNQPEVISVCLNNAAKALSDLVGETTPDTILEKIFGEFCIGK